RADAYYANALEPRAAALAAQPDFDPLAATIARAHGAGLRVHAWINVNLVAGVNELSAARDHVIYRHPEWLMVPRPIAEDLLAVGRGRRVRQAPRRRTVCVHAGVPRRVARVPRGADDGPDGAAARHDQSGAPVGDRQCGGLARRRGSRHAPPAGLAHLARSRPH